MCVQVPLSELLRQLNGNRVVVHVAVAIVVPSVLAVFKVDETSGRKSMMALEFRANWRCQRASGGETTANYSCELITGECRFCAIDK